MPLLPLTQTRTVGSLRVHALQAGLLQLDGGAMFGVVPKPLWERRIPADERNRIPLGMRCLLIEHPDALVLVDTGIGNKESEKFVDLYGVENAPMTDGAATQLESALAEVGFSPADVTLVINSHLHFDHAGGNTQRGEGGEPVVSFPNARHIIRRGEWDWAHHTNERTSASYFGTNYDPLHAAGLVELMDRDGEVLPGIELRRTPGHTPHHQGILVTSENDRLFFIADLSPTSSHVPLPWIMGYDVEPLVTLETKRIVWDEAAHDNWLLMFEHDSANAFGRLRREKNGWVCDIER